MNRCGVVRLLATVIGLALAGCDSSAPPADPRITWAGASLPTQQMVRDYLFGVGVAEENRPTLFSAEYFAESTPYFTYRGNDDAITVALSARVRGSRPPIDVYYIDLYWFKDFEPTWIKRLDDLTIPIAGQEQPLKDVITPGLLEACQLNGRLNAAPVSVKGNCLFYRADLIKSPPRTWPELIEQAQRVLAAQPAGSKLTQGIVFHWQGLHADLYPILWGYGGGPPTCLDAEGSLDRRLADEANLQAAEMFFDLVHRNKLSEEIAALTQRSLDQEREMYRAFVEGKCLFMIDWSSRPARILADQAEGRAAAIKTEDIGVAPIPCGPGGKDSYSTIGSWGWVIAEQPRSARSVEFVRQLSTPEAQLHFLEKYAEAPIFRPDVLTGLPTWPRTEARLRPFHRQLLELFHGSTTRRGVVLRNRPIRKEANRILGDALRSMLTEFPRDATGQPRFDRAAVRERFGAADRQVETLLRQLHALGVDCRCGAAVVEDSPEESP